MNAKRETRTNRGRDTVGRRSAIVEEIQRNQRVKVSELSRHFGVSEVSIRRDLEQLEETGLLQRIHGGAQALSLARQNFLFEARLLQNTQAKRAIGAAAATMIQPGMIALLDSGTTVLETARQIPRSHLDNGGLTLVTRSLAIASELRTDRHTRLIVLGGFYMHEFDDFVGGQVEQALQSLHVHALFIGTDGVTADGGLTTDNVLEAGLYRSMVKCADRVVVVTDSSKIGVNKLQTILSLDDIHTFITDTGAPDGFVKVLRERGVEVVLIPLS